MELAHDRKPRASIQLEVRLFTVSERWAVGSPDGGSLVRRLESPTETDGDGAPTASSLVYASEGTIKIGRRIPSIV